MDQFLEQFFNNMRPTVVILTILSVAVTFAFLYYKKVKLKPVSDFIVHLIFPVIISGLFHMIAAIYIMMKGMAGSGMEGLVSLFMSPLIGLALAIPSFIWIIGAGIVTAIINKNRV